MIELVPYSSEFKNDTIKNILDFYNFHSLLLNKKSNDQKANDMKAEKTLENWLQNSHEWYIIQYKEIVVGFLHIGYRGGNVAWIEDIYVAEEIIKSHEGYTSFCFDVVPQNAAALNLYYKLGYHNLSLITIRKELYENNRDRTEKFMGLDFKY